MSTWLCRRELHVLKHEDRNTPNLQWINAGYKPDGQIKWRARCRACDGLSCPQGHFGDSIVSVPGLDGMWRPACATCLTDGFVDDAESWSPEATS